MSNPLFQMLGGGNQVNMNGLLQQFAQFKSQFRGNPQQQVQELLNSGRVSQEQYNQAVQMANQMKKMLGM